MGSLTASDGRGNVRDPRGWLTTVVARIALDQLRSARVRREAYVGPWLPEPMVQAAGRAGGSPFEPGVDPADVVLWDESVRMAFLVVLDKLTPEQRIAIVLHDAAGVGFSGVAAVIGCTPAAARQHASRGRRRLLEADIPVRTTDIEGWALLAELAAALMSGDDQRLAALLAPDVMLVGDGGGHVTAARCPILGSPDVCRFLLGLAARLAEHATFQPALVNGPPGLVVWLDSDRPRDASVAVYAFGARDGRIAELYGVLAPDKVTRVPSAVELSG